MYITQHTDYALRALIYLGSNEDRLVTIQEISERFAVSRNHLMKVVNALIRAGFVEGVRGKGGGLRLALAPEDIGVGEVVRGTEESLALVECFDAESSTCNIAPACLLKGVFKKATEAFFAELDRYTLADLLRPASRLARILQPAK